MKINIYKRKRNKEREEIPPLFTHYLFPLVINGIVTKTEILV